MLLCCECEVVIWGVCSAADIKKAYFPDVHSTEIKHRVDDGRAFAISVFFKNTK